MSNYSEIVKSRNPLFYWRMNNISGNTIIDEMGRKNGTIVHNCLTNQINNAILGDSKAIKIVEDGYIDFGTDPAFAGNYLLIEFWFKLDGVKTRQIYSKWGSGGAEDDQYWCYVMAEGDLRHSWSKGSEWVYPDPSPQVFNNNEWHHMLVFFDTINGRYKVYRNGKKIQDDPLNISNIQNISEPFYIGGAPYEGSPSDFWISEFAIYDHPISDEEIEGNYRASLPEAFRNIKPILTNKKRYPYSYDELIKFKAETLVKGRVSYIGDAYTTLWATNIQGEMFPAYSGILTDFEGFTQFSIPASGFIGMNSSNFVLDFKYKNRNYFSNIVKVNFNNPKLKYSFDSLGISSKFIPSSYFLFTPYTPPVSCPIGSKFFYDNFSSVDNTRWSYGTDISVSGGLLKYVGGNYGYNNPTVLNISRNSFIGSGKSYTFFLTLKNFTGSAGSTISAGAWSGLGLNSASNSIRIGISSDIFNYPSQRFRFSINANNYVDENLSRNTTTIYSDTLRVIILDNLTSVSITIYFNEVLKYDGVIPGGFFYQNWLNDIYALASGDNRVEKAPNYPYYAVDSFSVYSELLLSGENCQG